MKRTIVIAAVLVCLTTAVVLIFRGGFSVHAQANFTNASVEGYYAGYANGSVVTPQGFVPFVSVVNTIFDGKGNLSGTQTLNLGGQVIRRTASGTYKVNPDGTGSATIAVSFPPNTVAPVDLVLSDNGRQMTLVQTDNTAVLSAILIKSFVPLR